MNWRTGTLVAVGGLALITTSACGAGSRSVQTNTYRVTDATSRLVIDNKAGTVAVTAGDGPITVTETVRYGHQRPVVEHTSIGGVLHLTSGSCWALFDSGCVVDYRVRVPAGTAVQVRADAGTVTVTGLAGDLNVTADAGAVRGTNLASAHTTVRADAGAVTLGYRSAPSTVDTQANAGSIDVRVPAGATYAVDATTNAGHTSVTVPVDNASPRRLTVHSDAGSVRVGSA